MDAVVILPVGAEADEIGAAEDIQGFAQQTLLLELQAAQRDTALMLARAAESKDPATGSHIERIYGYTLELARGLGLGEERAGEIASGRGGADRVDAGT